MCSANTHVVIMRYVAYKFYSVCVVEVSYVTIKSVYNYKIYALNSSSAAFLAV